MKRKNRNDVWYEHTQQTHIHILHTLHTPKSPHAFYCYYSGGKLVWEREKKYLKLKSLHFHDEDCDYDMRHDMNIIDVILTIKKNERVKKKWENKIKNRICWWE